LNVKSEQRNNGL